MITTFLRSGWTCQSRATVTPKQAFSSYSKIEYLEQCFVSSTCLSLFRVENCQALTSFSFIRSFLSFCNKIRFFLFRNRIQCSGQHQLRVDPGNSGHHPHLACALTILQHINTMYTCQASTTSHVLYCLSIASTFGLSLHALVWENMSN